MSKYKWGSILAQHGNDEELDKIEQDLSKHICQYPVDDDGDYICPICGKERAI